MRIPKKISIANLPTPLQKLQFDGCSFTIKRDDFTGLEMTGNKVRKLEYLIRDAKNRKADWIFTCGGDQSNHARATAFAAAAAGIKCKLFLWGADKKNADGNLFLDKMLGVEIQFLSKDEYKDVNQIMAEQAEKSNRNVYVIPSGGSSPVGIWGYINFFDELNKQTDLKKFKGILSACGSGGSAAGLMLGSAIHNLSWKIYAVNVLESKSEVEKEIFRLVDKCRSIYKIDAEIDKNNLVVLDGYSEEGYKQILPEKIKLIKKFVQTHGILFDPVYTGKAFYAYNQIFLQNKKKSDVLFLHTGGIFGSFNKRREYLSA